jgi:hypothetical protein
MGGVTGAPAKLIELKFPRSEGWYSNDGAISGINTGDKVMGEGGGDDEADEEAGVSFLASPINMACSVLIHPVASSDDQSQEPKILYTDSINSSVRAR